MKDEIFVLTTFNKEKDNELEKNKKMIVGLEFKIDKIKFEAEEAVVSRKPWVCLSCDKQDKDTKKESKHKKIDSSKFGGNLLI